MGQRFSRLRRFRWTCKGQKKTQDRPNPTLQAIETQGDVLVVPASSSQCDERYQPASKLMRIPLDVTTLIFDHLELWDAVAFSLTCRGLYYHLFADARSRRRDANHEDHYKVQTMLEKDLPHDQTYCYFCRTFHTLDPEYRDKFCREQDNVEHHSFATFLPGKLTHSLKYLDARAIMNAVLLNRPRALDTLLRLKQRFEVGTDENLWRQSWDPKVIGGELFIKIEAQHHQETAFKDKDEFSYSVCKHIHVHGKFPHMWVRHSQLERVCCWASRDRFVATCLGCDTDWKLEMSWIGGKEDASERAGWTLAIQSWHRLGDLRSPWRRSWVQSVGEFRFPNPRWIEGDTQYIIDHDDWERQVESYVRVHESTLHGSNEKLWIHAPEWGVSI